MSNKHLTYDDRLTIQAGLQQGLKIAQIAKNIGKDRSTVGRWIYRCAESACPVFWKSPVRKEEITVPDR